MQKGFAHLVLIAVFVLAILAAGGTYFFIFKDKPSGKLVPPTPPNPETQPWQTFSSEEAPFTFDYPQNWSIENTPSNGDYQGIALTGPEGEINMDWGSGFGGACGEDLVPLQLKNETLQICNEKNPDGSEDLRLISKQISEKIGFSARAHINNFSTQNRKVILKIFSTLSFKDDEKANWKTYENEILNYSLLIPSNWHATSDPTNMTITHDKSKGVVLLSGDEPCIGCGGVPRGITISGEKNNGQILKDAFIERHGENSPAFINRLSFEEISINGLSGMQVEGLMGAGCPGPEVWLRSENYIITLHSECIDESIRSKIVNSLKPLN